MREYAVEAEARGLEVIIAGAGGAAHLPGMTAAHTVLPVLGVPVQSHALQGLDSLLSIVQMPGGVPVADAGHRQGRRDQRGAAGGFDPRQQRPELRANSRRFARSKLRRSCATNCPPTPRRAGKRSDHDSDTKPILPGATVGV